MPPKRESLESVKKRLTREQQARIDRRIRKLLSQETEVSDDSEEENRLSLRRARGNRDQATKTDSSSLSFCCGVVVGVFVVLGLLLCLTAVSVNDRQRREGLTTQHQKEREEMWQAIYSPQNSDPIRTKHETKPIGNRD